jgi:glyoxylase-like metal-dependent hydrolase (beta-lactamase superfamily II)
VTVGAVGKEGAEGKMRFVIGEIVVDVIVDDDDFELPLDRFLPGLDLPALGEHRGLLEPDFVDLARKVLKCAIQTFVLRVAGRTILVDTCIGEHKDRPEIPAWNQRSGSGLLERLRRAGVDPAAVDTVFCTNLHIDHVGWNTQRADGSWAPTFPNAR